MAERRRVEIYSAGCGACEETIGRLAECCAGRGPDEASLCAAGVGRPL